MSSDNQPDEGAEDESIAAKFTGMSGSTRRKFIGTGAAAWASTSLAGCGGGDTDTATATDTDTDVDTPTDTATDTPEPQPENYVVTDEMATAGAAGVSFAASCSPTRLFAPGMRAIWEINVYDPETGEQLTSDDLSGVTVNVDGGPELEAEWMGDADEHPAPIWETSWVLPEDAETGEWTYTIEVTNGGDAGFTSVGEATGSFTVQADEMPDFYVSTETYWNGAPEDLPDGTNGFVGTCAPEREFFTTMDPTFYVQIYESETGKLVGAEAENNSEIDSISGTTIGSVTVRFPGTDQFDPLQLEWLNGFEDENTVPHWEATLTSPETLPTGSYEWVVDVQGPEGEAMEDWQIVGAASDVFNVIEQQ